MGLSPRHKKTALDHGQTTNHSVDSKMLSFRHDDEAIIHDSGVGMSDLSKDDIIKAVKSLSAANLCPASGTFFLPCTDHRPKTFTDADTGWVIIECQSCHMRIHLHPETYADLMISMEIDEIGASITGQT
jgi:hypothetical protein